MKTCPFCGAQLKADAHFCLHCMKSLDEKRVWQISQRHNKRWQGILAAVFAIFVTFVSLCLIPTTKPTVSVDTPTATSTAQGTNTSAVGTDRSSTTETTDATTVSSLESGGTTRVSTRFSDTISTTVTATAAEWASTTNQTNGTTTVTTPQQTSTCVAETIVTQTEQTTTQETTTNSVSTTTATAAKETKQPIMVPKPPVATIMTDEIPADELTFALPKGFPQVGDRFYSSPVNEYYQETQSLYCEIQSAVCQRESGTPFQITYTLSVSSSDVYSLIFSQLVYTADDGRIVYIDFHQPPENPETWVAYICISDSEYQRNWTLEHAFIEFWPQ